MKNFLLMFITFSMAVVIGLSVTAEEPQNKLLPPMVLAGELPPPLTTPLIVVQSSHAESCHGGNYRGPGFVRGQLVRNVLRWIFRPRLRRAWRCR